MPIVTRTPDVISFLVIGFILLAFSIYKLLQARSSAPAQLKWLTAIDASTFFLALGLGGVSGFSSAFLIVLFVGSARLLAFLSLNQLCAESKSVDLAKLAGVGKARPVTAMFFAFAMFAAFGISPFLTPDAKPLLMYAAFDAGQPFFAALMALVNILVAFYTVRLVHPIWLGQGAYEPKKQFILAEGCFIPLLLACALVIMGVFGHSFVNMAANFTGFKPELLPDLSIQWNLATLILYLAGLVLFFIRNINRASFYLCGLGAFICAFIYCLSVTAVHPLSQLFSCIVAGMGTLIWCYSYGYFGTPKDAAKAKAKEASYSFFFFLMFGSLIGLARAEHSLSFFIFWELMTFSSYVLIAHEETEAAEKASQLYFIMCTGAAAFLLPVLLFFAHSTASFSWLGMQANMGLVSSAALTASAFFALIAFGVKAGLMPGHAWLPAAHPAAPSSISAPLSGILTKAGIFGIVLLLFLVMGAANAWQGQESPVGSSVFFILSIAGAVTMAYGEFMALKQDDIKRLFAYSTMGQIGEITLTLSVCSLLAATATVFHVLNHAIMKDLLFLGSGALILRAGGQKLEDLKGLGKVMPFTVTCMVIGLLSIMGLPPFAGFMSKYLMVTALAKHSVFLAALMLLASLAGCVYYMRIIRVLVFEPCDKNYIVEAPLTMRIPLAILAVLCVLLGLFPNIGLSWVLPVVSTALNGASISLAALPPLLESKWPIFSIVLLIGGFVPLLKRENPEQLGKYTTAILLLAAFCVVLFGRSLDTVSFAFALIVPLIGAVNMHYATEYMLHSHAQWRFYSFFLFMCAGLTGVAASSDLFNFFLFWEIMSSWSLYFVIVHEENEAALREGFKYFFFNVTGAAFLFLGVAVLASKTGTLEFSALPQIMVALPAADATLIVFLMATGFIMKAAQLPFRIDIQMHPATAPTPVSGYISSVLLKSALFGICKLFFALGGIAFFAQFAGRELILEAVLWIGGITIVMAAAYAVIQTDIKRMLIYSTVSQLGYMVIAIALCTPLGVAGGLLHLVNHVFFKNLLFLVAGALIVQTGKHSLNDMGGLGWRMPKTFALFAVGAFCVIGIPPSNGFTSKWIIYHALMEQGYVLLAIFSLAGSVLTLAYFTKLMHTAFLGQASADATDKIKDPPKRMIMSMSLLAAACIITSIFPGILLSPINTILAEFNLAQLDVAAWGIASGRGAWNATTTSVFFLVIWFGGRYLLLRLSKKQRVGDIHVCGIPPEDLNLQGAAQDLYSAPVAVAKDFKETIIRYFKQ